MAVSSAGHFLPGVLNIAVAQIFPRSFPWNIQLLQRPWMYQGQLAQDLAVERPGSLRITDLSDWTETPATCTENSSKDRTCTSCGASDHETTPALGHGWGDWVLTAPPTEEHSGMETGTCSRCLVTETRDVTKLEQQDIRFPASSMTKTYGDPEVYNAAMNPSPDGDHELAYASSVPAVAGAYAVCRRRRNHRYRHRDLFSGCRLYSCTDRNLPLLGYGKIMNKAAAVWLRLYSFKKRMARAALAVIPFPALSRV